MLKKLKDYMTKEKQTKIENEVNVFSLKVAVLWALFAFLAFYLPGAVTLVFVAKTSISLYVLTIITLMGIYHLTKIG